MSGQIRFHLDENISNAVAKGLSQRGIDVTTTAKENLIGVSDQEQIMFALSQGRVLVTQDDDFLRLHQSGILHSGIAYCKKGSRSTGEIIQTLTLIWECVAPAEISEQVEFI
jgi:uncharacterized protein with PIN domain